MILTCPNCSTRYTLQASQLPSGGRTVRCAACKTTWHAEKSEEPIELPLAAKPAPARAEDLQSVKAKKLPGQYRAMVEDKKRLKALTAQGIVWASLAAVALIVVTIGFLLRVDIVRAFPRVAGAYAMVGLPVNAAGLTLISKEGDSKASFRNGRFVVTVTAQVTNLRDKPTPVPPIKVKLLDGTLQQFDYVIIPSSGLVVEPHATRTLTFDVKDPKNMVAHLDLDFDLEGMKKSKPGSSLRHKATGDHGEGQDSDHDSEPAAGHDDHDAGEAPETTHETAGPEHAEVASGSEIDLFHREPQAQSAPRPANEHTNDIADSHTQPHDDGPALRDRHS